MPLKNLKLRKIEATFEGRPTQTFSLKQKGRTFVRGVSPRTTCCQALTTNTTVECDGRNDANEFFCVIETAVINRVLTQSDHILFWAVLKHYFHEHGNFFW